MNAMMKRAQTFTLARYDEMCHAIAECHDVDEVQDIHDKALAVELYLRQAQNTDAERKATDVRIRAERRSGELLKELERNQGGGGKFGSSNDGTNRQSEYGATLERNGISRQTASRYQALANVPEEVFERHLADPDARASTTRILRDAVEAATAPRIDPDALRLWGKMRDWEREREGAFNTRELVSRMTESMQADVKRLAPAIADYWAQIADEVRSHD